MKDYIKNTLKYYDDNADVFKEKWLNDFIQNYNFEIPDIFLSYLNSNSYILDLGCGTGRDSKYFMEKGHKVKSIDGSYEMCKIAKELLNLEVDQINFLDMNYENIFDGVFACASLLHLSKEDLITVLKKVSASLKQDGIFYTCFKLGEENRIDNGKFYNDMTEDKFVSICNNIKELEIIKMWLSDQYKTDTKFINFILKKR